MMKQPTKKNRNIILVGLAAVGGFFLLRKFFGKCKEEKQGYCESLGEKIDHGLGHVVHKVGEMVDPKGKE